MHPQYSAECAISADPNSFGDVRKLWGVHEFFHDMEYLVYLPAAQLRAD
jgi:hypothetical protein